MIKSKTKTKALLMATIVLLSVYLVVPSKSFAATYKPFVSEVWRFDNYDSYQKKFKKDFPKKLSNGLTVSTIKFWDEFHVPAVKKGSNVIWSADNFVDSTGNTQFAYTKNGDLFITYSHIFRGLSYAEIVGINKKGEIFLKKSAENSSATYKFLSSDYVQLTYYDSNNKKNDTFYKYTKDGKMVKTTYIDKEFATFAKQGKLRSVYGNVGMTYKTLKKKTSGHTDSSEAFLWHKTWDESYGFFYGKSHSKIYPEQKVVLITSEIFINQSGKEIEKELNKYFGKPIAKKVYKAGKYYISYDIYEKGSVQFYIGTKQAINIISGW